ncbi:MAG: glycosyltransferase family 39 protein [Anaerolineae bacterium]
MRGLEIGLWAACLVATSPYQIWHAREARMYALSTTLGLASSLLFLCALRRGGILRWASYVAITALGLYTHYYALFLLAFQAIFWLAFCRKKTRRTIQLPTSILHSPFSILQSPFPTALVAVGVLFLPWLAFGAWRILIAYHGNGDSPAFLDMVRRLFLAFGLGESSEVGVYFLPILVLVFVFGLWEASRLGWRGLAFLLLYLAVPVLSVYAASLRRPVFNERYLAAASPPYYIILALGLAALRHLPGRWNWSGILCALLLFGGSAHSLYGYYMEGETGPGWRELARRLEEMGQDGDFILANYTDPTPWYYYRGELPHTVLPASRPLDEEATIAELSHLASSYKRIWFIPLPSPDWDAEGFVGRWLDLHCDRTHEESLGQLRLELYLTPQAFRARMTPVGAIWEGKIRLAGYRLETKSQVLKPGWPLYLTLYWEALAEIESSYTVFTHLLGPEGRIWGQKDGLPAHGSYPTLAWKPGETIVDKRVIIISADAPPGKYALEIGWYEGETGRRLLLEGGEDKLTLLELEVGSWRL